MKKLSEMSVAELKKKLKQWQDANEKPLPAGLAAMPTMHMYHEKITELQQELARRKHAGTHQSQSG